MLLGVSARPQTFNRSNQGCEASRMGPLKMLSWLAVSSSFLALKLLALFHRRWPDRPLSARGRDWTRALAIKSNSVAGELFKPPGGKREEKGISVSALSNPLVMSPNLCSLSQHWQESPGKIRSCAREERHRWFNNHSPATRVRTVLIKNS